MKRVALAFAAVALTGAAALGVNATAQAQEQQIPGWSGRFEDPYFCDGSAASAAEDGHRVSDCVYYDENNGGPGYWYWIYD